MIVVKPRLPKNNRMSRAARFVALRACEVCLSSRGCTADAPSSEMQLAAVLSRKPVWPNVLNLPILRDKMMEVMLDFGPWWANAYENINYRRQ